MAEDVKKCTPCVEKKVTELIANSQGKFVEADREWLEALSETQLDKLTPTVVEKEVVKEVVKEVNVLSEDDRAALADYKKQLKEKRDGLIKGIQDNSEKGAWAEGELENMKDEVLVKVYNLTKKEERHDYSLNGVNDVQVNTSGELPMAPTGVTFKTK